MGNDAGGGARILAAAGLALLMAAAAVEAQPLARLTDGARPPTRVIPGDQVEMTVFDTRLFPAGGTWTIGGRPVRATGLAPDGAYRLAFRLPPDFPDDWNRLPIVYRDVNGRVSYDSAKEDAQAAVALADVSDPAPFLAGKPRITGVTGLASQGERVCVCGLFPDGASRQGLSIGGIPLGIPLTGSTTELWFEIPASVTPGIHQITGDPAAGFSPEEDAPVEVVDSAERVTESDEARCPCVGSIGFLSAWRGGRTYPAEIIEAASVESESERAVRRVALAPDRAAEPPEGTLIWIESVGGSTGEVAKVHVVNPGAEPFPIGGYAAIEPVSIGPSERAKLLEQLRRAPGAHQDLPANFYCLQLRKQVPSEGMAYRIAGPEKQEQFRPAARALAAARRLYEAGELNVEGDPDVYFHSIRQWALWTLENSFDHDRFVDAFTEHARKNFARIGQPWSDAVEAAVRQHADRRWQDISLVLEAAEATPGGS